MQAGKVIYDRLSTDTDLVSLLDGEKRIYPIFIPQESNFPAVVYTSINELPSDSKDGVSSVDEVRMQIDVYAKGYGSMQAIEERIRELLDHFSGEVNGVNVDLIWFHNANEIGEPELNLRHRAIDFNMRINRNI